MKANAWFRLVFQRSWNYYKPGYGTLSLLFRKHGVVTHKALFHWKSLPNSEVDFRFDILRKLKVHPSKSFINSCIYRLWFEYTRGIKLPPLTKWERFVGTTAVIYMRHRYSV